MSRNKKQILVGLVIGCLGFLMIGPVFAESHQPSAEQPLKLTTDPEQRTTVIFEAFDADRSGTLNEDEFAKAVIKVFASLDANHDDVVEPSELPAGWNSEMDQMDTSDNQKIEFSEVAKFIEKAFKERDADQNGALSREEVKNRMEQLQAEQKKQTP